MSAPDLLRALLAAPGPSGHEEEPSRIWREAASAFAEVSSDTMGSSFARVRAGDGAPTFVVMGHIDEIGVTITNVEDDGMLSFTPIGGMSPATLIGQRLELMTRDGTIPGVVERKRIPQDQLSDPPKPALADLHIDIGARDKDDAHARRASERDLGVDVVAVAAVQEEIGPYGARTAAYELDPLVGVAVDVTPATDVPGGDARRAGPVKLGAGAMIARGPTLNKLVTDLLAETAEAEGIPHAFEIYSRITYTDADEIHITRSGVPTGLVSIPTRYLHTPTEICDLADLEAIVRLLVAFAQRLGRDSSFVR